MRPPKIGKPRNEWIDGAPIGEKALNAGWLASQNKACLEPYSFQKNMYSSKVFYFVLFCINSIQNGTAADYEEILLNQTTTIDLDQKSMVTLESEQILGIENEDKKMSGKKLLFLTDKS